MGSTVTSDAPPGARTERVLSYGATRVRPARRRRRYGERKMDYAREFKREFDRRPETGQTFCTPSLGRKESVLSSVGSLRICLGESGLPIEVEELEDAQTWQRLRRRARELAPLFSGEDARYQALSVLLRRFVDSDVESKQLLTALIELLVSQLELARLDDTTLVERALLGKTGKGNGPAKAEVPVVLDAAGDFYPVAVASPKMKLHVGRCLSRRLDHSDSHELGRCVLSGEEQPLVTHRIVYPEH